MKNFPYIRQLLSPLSYLFIKHSCCIRISWVYSILLSLCTVSSLYFFSYRISYNAFIPDASQFFGLLSGFYIASLSILASNGNAYLDENLKGEQPYLHGKLLNRRSFLCLLLGYLTFISIILFLLTMFMDMFINLNKSNNDFVCINNYGKYLKIVFFVVYYWLFFSLITNTLLCVHFIFINLPFHSENKK